MRVALVSAGIAVLLSGCASDVPRRLQEAEQTFETNGPITRLFHASLYYPNEIRLQHDGFLVGIEKSPREKVLANGEMPVTGIVDSNLGRDDAKKLLNDGKVLFVSHVLASYAQDRKVCSLYNAYEIQKAAQLVDRCDAALPAAPAAQAYHQSWNALQTMKATLASRLAAAREPYTHVLVMTMGWNTDQEEAVRNFNSLANSAQAAAGPGFRPLVVGVTWPGAWASQWFDPLIKLVSFGNKAKDADELGVSWLGVVLHDTLAPARERKIPIVAIGHSFGSRAMSAAACVGPVIYRDQPIGRAQVDHLVNWQGAFMIRRLFGEGEDHFRYPTACPNVGNLVLTASEHDAAVEKSYFGKYAGERKSYTENCSGSPAIRCAAAEASGKLGAIGGKADSSILYIDAGALISENAYGTGGGAHSDIYRTEHGRMMLEAMGYSRESQAQR